MLGVLDGSQTEILVLFKFKSRSAWFIIAENLLQPTIIFNLVLCQRDSRINFEYRQIN